MRKVENFYDQFKPPTTTTGAEVQVSFAEVEAHEVTEEAIQRVDDHGEPDGKALLLIAVYRVALRELYFTTDDVWALEPVPGVHEPRVMGAIMRTAAKKGWIEPTDRYEKSKRVKAHRNPKLVWRSLVRSF